MIKTERITIRIAKIFRKTHVSYKYTRKLFKTLYYTTPIGFLVSLSFKINPL